MNLGAGDLGKLKYSLLAAVLMAAAGGAAVYVADGAMRAARLERAAALAQRNEFDGKLKRVRNEENEIKQKAALFALLQGKGIVGEEQRLEWVETLRGIRDRRRLIDLQYELMPQRPLPGPAGSAFTFYASTMKLQFKPLHEEDLLRLLGDLRQQASALIQINSCSIARLPRGGPADASQAQLQAECLVDWITVRPSAAAPAK